MDFGLHKSAADSARDIVWLFGVIVGGAVCITGVMAAGALLIIVAKLALALIG